MQFFEPEVPVKHKNVFFPTLLYSYQHQLFQNLSKIKVNVNVVPI